MWKIPNFLDTESNSNVVATRYNIISVIFLGIFTIPHIGVKWLSYVLPFSCFSVLPIMLMVKEEYKRRTVDDDDDKKDDQEEESEDEK